MIHRIPRRLLIGWLLTLPAAAQQPDALLHSITAPPGVQTGASLGFGVAVDGGHAVAGAPYSDFGAENAGAVKVFHPTTGELLHLLTNPGPALDENFGLAVAISGNRLVVGAPFDNTGAQGAGSVYIYDLGGATPTVPVMILNNPTPSPSEGFGCSVALSGSRLAIGARQDSTGASSAGIAYVYDLNGGTPAEPRRFRWRRFPIPNRTPRTFSAPMSRSPAPGWSSVLCTTTPGPPMQGAPMCST